MQTPAPKQRPRPTRARGHPFPTWRGRRSLRRRSRLHTPLQSNSRTFVSALRQFRPGTALMRRVHRDRLSPARRQPRRPLDLNREEPRGSSFRANGCRLARSAKLLPAHREAPPIRRLRLPLRLPQSSGVDVHNGISMQLSHTRTPTCYRPISTLCTTTPILHRCGNDSFGRRDGADTRL